MIAKCKWWTLIAPRIWICVLLAGLATAGGLFVALSRKDAATVAAIAADRLRANGCIVAERSAGRWLVFVDGASIDDERFSLCDEYIRDFRNVELVFGLNAAITDESVHVIASRDNISSLILQSPGLTDHAVTLLGRMTGLDQLALDGEGFHNECLESIGEITSIRSLRLSTCGFKRGFLRGLAGARQLRDLTCVRLPIGEGDIKALSGLRSLRSLELLRCDVSAIDVTEIGAVRGLTALRLLGVNFENRGAPFLSHLGSLKSLSIESCVINEAFLADLCAADAITYLSLRYSTPTNDELVGRIACLSSLASLDLSGTEITDASASWPLEMVALKEISIEDTAVSVDTAMRLPCKASRSGSDNGQ